MKNNNLNLVFLIAFIEGASLMGVEIISAKIISPFFGNSLLVWSSVFTMTIGGLTLGYFIGGKLSKKFPPIRSVILFFIFACIWLYILPNISILFFESFKSFSVKSGVLLFSLILILPIVICFGAISPILIRYSTSSIKNVGKASSNIYTISTLGGVILTFLIGLYFIPNFGIINSISIICVLILLGCGLCVILLLSNNKIATNEGGIKSDKKSIIESTEKLKSKNWLYFIAFIEGAIVIAVEILGSKMIQPFIGNSLFIWTVVIGTTIIFLTIGYYLGGIYSKKENLIPKLAIVLSLATFFIILMPILTFKLFDVFLNDSILLNGILMTSLLIGPALICLGITSPIIIQLLTKEVESSGEIAGKVYAISSFGGILMTLILGFFLLEFWGIVKSIMLFSILLSIISLFIFRNSLQYIIFVSAIFLELVVYSLHHNLVWEKRNFKLQYMSEGLMGQLKIYDEYFPLEQLEYRFLLINGIHQTIIVNNNVNVSTWNYVHRISRICSKKRGGNALLLGLGGGSIASELNKLKIKSDLVDIDKRMFEISKDYFYFNDSISKFYYDDARHFVNINQKKYDLVILDVANGENQPSNLFTIEGFGKIKKLLKRDGLIILNFQEFQKGYKISAHHSICNTLLELGFTIQYHKSEDKLADIITVASMMKQDLKNISISQLSSSYPYLGIVQELIQEPFVEVNKPFMDGVVLIDDKPMLDILNAKTILEWRLKAIKNVTKQQIENDHPIYH
ncbi:MAG: spermidine synthase [Flavobacteriia bacterium]|nr:spermidine synthase [Flavobacteriia bacterium]